MDISSQVNAKKIKQFVMDKAIFLVLLLLVIVIAIINPGSCACRCSGIS